MFYNLVATDNLKLQNDFEELSANLAIVLAQKEKLENDLNKNVRV